MWKFILGALVGAGSMIYLHRDTGDYMWHAGYLSSIQDAYDFTCGKAAVSRHDDKFWKAKEDAIERSHPNDVLYIDTLEYQAIVHAVVSCDYLSDDSLKLAKEEIAKHR